MGSEEIKDRKSKRRFDAKIGLKLYFKVRSFLRSWKTQNALIEQSKTLIEHSAFSYRLCMQSNLYSYLCTATLTIAPNILSCINHKGKLIPPCIKSILKIILSF